MGQFEGFADAEGRFFKSLARHQKREWFQAHKAEFEVGWNEPMKLLLGDVAEAIDSAFDSDLAEPKVFRIFRNLRFSKDKTPYKTFIAGVIPVKRVARTTETPIALYMHFGTENVVASGLYVMEPVTLARYRSAVADDRTGKELVKILAKLAKSGFPEGMAHDDSVLKRVPKGFDPEHPRAELLKRKSLGVGFPPLPNRILATPKLAPWLTAHAKKVAPLVDWLVRATA